MSRGLRFLPGLGLLFLLGVAPRTEAGSAENPETPRFSRHVQAVFSRAGCNGGTCHGAVKGQNGFQLSLFGADPVLDHDRLLRQASGRRLNLLDPAASLLLRKATGQVVHGGGPRLAVGSPEYEILRRWIAGGAPADPVERSRVLRLQVHPDRATLQPEGSQRLRVEASFADNTTEDVTALCSFQSVDPTVATVGRDGVVLARGAGTTALLVRFRAEPAVATLVVPRRSAATFPELEANNFIDQHIHTRLRQLQIPPSGRAEDALFLRRASLDVTGELPTSQEVRAFLADPGADKREHKIDELLARPGYAALWTLKFCDLLKGSDFGVYADGIRQELDAPRFQQWVRARLEENTPWDEFAERILTATSREGRDLETWAREVVQLEEGYGPGRPDVQRYRQRRTLDLYWQRNSSPGVPAALQVAHAFLGLRLECAQCHRHPHDVWQQDDLLSFANFFMPVRRIGFQGDNEKMYPDAAAHFKRLNEEAKGLSDQAKKLREGEFKKKDPAARAAKAEADRIGREIARLEKEAEQARAGGQEAKARQADDAIARQRQLLAPHQATLAEFEALKQRLSEMERRSKLLPEAARRLMHAEVRLLEPGKTFASVSSPIGTQTSKHYRLLGQTENLVVTDPDPRRIVMAWMRRPDNPWFARAIVNRIWAHYFGRGIVDPPDNLSSFNPATHPELLQELSDRFVQSGYDLKWLHRTILRSRTYQQSSQASPGNESDRTNHARFYYRRLPAEVLLDALNQATGTTEKMDMMYYHWPADLKTVEIPFASRNAFVTFMLANFGQPKRNAAVQCDCERDSNASVLQILSLANHPRIWAKITDEKGQVARILKEIPEDRQRVEELFLVALSRLPSSEEQQACTKYLQQAESPSKGYQGILWTLLNTREFLLQH